jgi:hypothetical protein
VLTLRSHLETQINQQKDNPPVWAVDQATCATRTRSPCQASLRHRLGHPCWPPLPRAPTSHPWRRLASLVRPQPCHLCHRAMLPHYRLPARLPAPPWHVKQGGLRHRSGSDHTITAWPLRRSIEAAPALAPSVPLAVGRTSDRAAAAASVARRDDVNGCDDVVWWHITEELLEEVLGFCECSLLSCREERGSFSSRATAQSDVS